MNDLSPTLPSTTVLRHGKALQYVSVCYDTALAALRVHYIFNMFIHKLHMSICHQQNAKAAIIPLVAGGPQKLSVACSRVASCEV